MMISEIERKVRANMHHVAALGNWPAYKDVERSLVGRLPLDPESKAPGFDAGIACALDLIPRNRQRLSAILHGAYTPEAVEQVRSEVDLDDAAFADTETCWWLAASHICNEGDVWQDTFRWQVDTFRALTTDLEARVDAAREEYALMLDSFTVMADGVPYVTVDGGMQGAYLRGHELAVQWIAPAKIFFVGTFRESLGIPEDFSWTSFCDEQNRSMSGPVHGAKNFVKCATLDELAAVVKVACKHLDV